MPIDIDETISLSVPDNVSENMLLLREQESVALGIRISVRNMLQCLEYIRSSSRCHPHPGPRLL